MDSLQEFLSDQEFLINIGLLPPIACLIRKQYGISGRDMSSEEQQALSLKIMRQASKILRKQFGDLPYDVLHNMECSMQIRKNLCRRVELQFQLLDFEKKFLKAIMMTCEEFTMNEKEIWMLISRTVPEKLRVLQRFMLRNTHFIELESDIHLEAVLNQAYSKANIVLVAIARARNCEEYYSIQIK